MTTAGFNDLQVILCIAEARFGVSVIHGAKYYGYFRITAFKIYPYFLPVFRYKIKPFLSTSMWGYQS